MSHQVWVEALSSVQEMLSVVRGSFKVVDCMDVPLDKDKIRGMLMVISDVEQIIKDNFRTERLDEALCLLSVVKGRIEYAAEHIDLQPLDDELSGLGHIISRVWHMALDELIAAEDSEIEGGGADDFEEEDDNDEAVEPDDAARGILGLLAGEVGWPRILSGFLRGTNEGRDLVQKAA